MSSIVTRPLRPARTFSTVNTGIYIRLLNSSSPETEVERQESFVNIFRNKLWEGQVSPVNGSDVIIGSGPGSTLTNTVNVTNTLNVVIEQVKLILGRILFICIIEASIIYYVSIYPNYDTSFAADTHVYYNGGC